MRRVTASWDLPHGTFRVDWKVIDRKEYWRVEGSNGEFFHVPKREAPTWKDIKHILQHFYDDDVEREWQKYTGVKP